MQAQTQQPTVEVGIRIYVADLAAYNNGHLHGAWIDATQEVEAIHECIAAMLACSPITGAQEYAIHDFEGFGSYRLNESDGIERVQEIACFIEEFPEFGAELLDHCSDLDEARKAAGENYAGCYASLADYAQELTEEIDEIPPSVAPYIDYERMARDMELGGDVFTVEGASHEVHIFWNR